MVGALSDRVSGRQARPGRVRREGVQAREVERDPVGSRIRRRPVRRKLAVTKAKENIAELGLDESETMANAVLISDAFFPFPDNIHNAAAAGIKFIVEPGGSKRDAEVIAAADEYGMALAFTGMRHFKH